MRRNLCIADFVVFVLLHNLSSDFANKCINDRQMKQYLMKIMPGVIICFAAASCSLVELGAEQKDEQNGGWNGPSISPPSTVRSITFVSAFDYVEGYDWQADSQKGEVKCSLVVFQ